MTDAAAELPLLKEPADGVPDLTDTEAGYRSALTRLARGSGWFAVDTERASGFRYGQRAFLIQIRREGAGTFLIDPEALPDLSELNTLLQQDGWILHAASQDLPCLREAGLNPPKIFDTELAGRLLGRERVGLAGLCEDVLGVRLAKAHSAADWSQRPLTRAMLAYAALDVELLDELKDRLSEELAAAGKLAWAEEEFQAVLDAPPPPPAQQAWRRTKGSHELRSRRELAVLRALWKSREILAKQRDVAPWRVAGDKPLIAAAQTQPKTVPQLLEIPGFQGKRRVKDAPRWVAAIERGLLTSRLPDLKFKDRTGPPPTQRWARGRPEAAARYQTARPRIQATAEQWNLPAENLLPPAVLRAICWQPPAVIEPETITEELARLGARNWQIQLCAPILTVAFLDPNPLKR